MCPFVLHLQIFLTLLSHQIQNKRNEPHTSHVPLLLDRSSSLSGPGLLALLGGDTGISFS